MAKKRAINIRLRPDQLREIAKIVADDPDKVLDRSKIISIAIDSYLTNMGKGRGAVAGHHIYHGLATPAEMQKMEKGQQIRIGPRIRGIPQRPRRRRQGRPTSGSGHA